MTTYNLKRGTELDEKIEGLNRLTSRLGEYIEQCIRIKKRGSADNPYFDINVGDSDNRVTMRIDESEARELRIFLIAMRDEYSKEFDKL